MLIAFNANVNFMTFQIIAKPIRAGQGHVQGGIRSVQANPINVVKPVLPKTFSQN